MGKPTPSAGTSWFFGLLREAGGYRIVAAGPSEARVRRELDPYTNPTLIATLEDLPSLNVGEVEWRRWLPGAATDEPHPGAVRS